LRALKITVRFSQKLFWLSVTIGILWLCGFFVHGSYSALAAPLDTSKNTTVNILFARAANGTQTDSGTIQKLIDSVVLQQGANLMRCDSAYLNLQTNNLEAFGNVTITQPGGTQVASDYLRYMGNKKLAYLKGNVALTDGRNSLWSEDLTYDVGTRTGVYNNGGTLQSDTTTVSSNEGTYNLNSKDARFKGEVYISDPKYNVTSDDLGYNTETKLVRFFGPSIVTNEKSELRTSNGTYDSKLEIAHFISRSSIRNVSQYIEADTLDYNKPTGWGIARGKVIAIDTQNHSTMWSGYASYNEISRKLFARIKPVLRDANGKDTLYIAADTFYSAPEKQLALNALTVKDSSGIKTTRGNKKKTTIAAATPIEPPADTTAPRYYIGFHHVRIWSDSLQGRCDSIAYLPHDSVMKMMGKPVAWSRESQITGDTLLLYLDTSRIKRLFVPSNALVVSRTGPAKAQLYDQVQGKTLTAFFKNNKVDYMIVFPAAESIYYPKDDQGRYLGVSQAEAERMKVYLKDNKIHRILLEQEPKQKMTPLDKANLPTMRLSRFQWLEEKRPKGKQELFD
jgi:lipopolysaccharide export system protein LptA